MRHLLRPLPLRYPAKSAHGTTNKRGTLSISVSALGVSMLCFRANISIQCRSRGFRALTSNVCKTFTDSFNGDKSISHMPTR